MPHIIQEPSNLKNKADIFVFKWDLWLTSKKNFICVSYQEFCDTDSWSSFCLRHYKE